MVVVMTFAKRHKVYVIIVTRVDLVVVGTTAEQMGCRIDEPGGVQRSDVLGKHSDGGPPDEFVPEVAGNEDGHEETEEQVQGHIESEFVQKRKN